MSKEDILARIPNKWGKYIDIGEGWCEIVFELDRGLAALDPDYTIAQVKEKFGGLRFYINTIDPAYAEVARKFVQAAEAKAAVTCDVCGEPGTQGVANGWYATRCEAHKNS